MVANRSFFVYLVNSLTVDSRLAMLVSKKTVAHYEERKVRRKYTLKYTLKHTLKQKKRRKKRKKKSRVLLLFLSEILFHSIIGLNTRIAMLNVKNERISRFLIIFMLFWCLKPKIG